MLVYSIVLTIGLLRFTPPPLCYVGGYGKAATTKIDQVATYGGDAHCIDTTCRGDAHRIRTHSARFIRRSGLSVAISRS